MTTLIEIVYEHLQQFLTRLVALDVVASPVTFAALTALAIGLIWLALAPSRAEVGEKSRLAGYLHDTDLVEEQELQRSFLRRAVLPVIRKVLGTLGELTPVRDVQRVQRLLVQAGEPAGLAAPDILGLQILGIVVPAAVYLLFLRSTGRLGDLATPVVVRNVALVAVLGCLAPRLWLRTRAQARQHDIIRNFSDALDLLSVSVDAGLALDSAIVRVCERWHNALTDELNRVTLEMRVGTPRNVALQRMADRTGVQDLQTFVGVLIQSTELGVSIADTLHSQAAQVRVRRRQRAEELAHQASVKMVFALVFLIFPALLVVLLGPGVPRIFEALRGL